MRDLRESLAKRFRETFQGRQTDLPGNFLKDQKPLSIEDLFEKIESKLEEKGVTENQLLKAKEVRGLVQGLRITGLEDRIGIIFGAVSGKALQLLEGEDNGVRMRYFQRDQVFAFAVICSTASEMYYSKGRKIVGSWNAVFAGAKNRLTSSSKPDLADLIILQKKAKNKSAFHPGSQPLVNFMPSNLLLDSEVPVFVANVKELDFSGVKDPSLGRELELFQRSNGDYDLHVDGTILRISSALGVKFNRDDHGGWPRVLADTAFSCKVLKSILHNGARKFKSMDDLLLCFALCYVNKIKLSSERIDTDVLKNIINETVNALGTHPLAAKLLDTVKTFALFSEEKKTLIENSQAHINEYKPDDQILKQAEGWDKKALLAAFEKLRNIPFSNLLDSTDSSFKEILSLETVELATYIFVTMQRKGFNELRHVLENLNVLGVKKIVNFCLSIISDEKYKVNNLRELYEKTERYKKSPNYLNPTNPPKPPVKNE